ncbi:uncharacterized protein LOC116347522 [Contarinia nasturtii]|uniref:uncharacterized protein LOC116347522 n=1 Tax=Contarinia nasturtii TaxID=265458 RepID=UPI0012D38437|nr:uncharacterized protein LOC116347522 [Contarinia nasturtii]
MDMEKIDTEFEFYEFTLEELKNQYETMFRLHCKKMIEKFSNDVISSAQKEFTVETANNIKSFAEKDAMKLIKPETVKLLLRANSYIDKVFTIPPSVPVGENFLQNTPEMDEYENKCKLEIAELDLVYKQQAIMMNYLQKELEMYDSSGLIEESEIDMSMCDMFDNNFTDTNLNSDVVEKVVQMLHECGIKSDE